MTQNQDHENPEITKDPREGIASLEYFEGLYLEVSFNLNERKIALEAFSKYAKYFAWNKRDDYGHDPKISPIGYFVRRYSSWVKRAITQSYTITFEELSSRDPDFAYELFIQLIENGFKHIPRLPDLVNACMVLEQKNDGNFPLKNIDLSTERNNSTHWGELRKLLPDSDPMESARKLLMEKVFAEMSKLPFVEVERISNEVTDKLRLWPDNFPKVAPEFYQNRVASEKLPEFLRRVYGEFLDGSFTTAHLYVLDKPAADAIRGYIQKHKKLPDDILIPSKFGVENKKRSVETVRKI